MKCPGTLYDLRTQTRSAVSLADHCDFVTVVYFNQLLGAASTQKLVKLLFSAVFNLFCSFQTFFSDFMPEINKKRLKKNKKKCVFVYSSQLVGMQKLVDSLRGYIEFVFFWKNIKKVKINQKKTNSRTNYNAKHYS